MNLCDMVVVGKWCLLQWGKKQQQQKLGNPNEIERDDLPKMLT